MVALDPETVRFLDSLWDGSVVEDGVGSTETVTDLVVAFERCPECDPAGDSTEDYRITRGPSQSTLLHVEVFYSSRTGYHHHDPNVTRVEFRCSKGHSWFHEERVKCPSCGDEWRKC